jgi:Na+/H+ antiporter NhaD/arsenite permease-like protein
MAVGKRRCRREIGFFMRALVLVIFLLAPHLFAATSSDETRRTEFPRPLDGYTPQPANASVIEILKARIEEEPFNLIATIIFFLAIAHTFAAPTFLRLSHRFEREHQERLAKSELKALPGSREEVSLKAQIFHFLGEIEAIFGIWVIPLLIAITLSKGWSQASDYIGHGLNFTEPLFVVVIMAMAASRPILKLSEQLMAFVAAIGKGSPAAWWLSILTIGPILGSFITEPAAMTISALLLCEKFYERKPSPKFAYATLGLLFVNVSVGGTLTHFAAPPVLMVADKWGWGMSHMFLELGWKAVVVIVVANVLYYVGFRSELQRIAPHPSPLPVGRGEGEDQTRTSQPIPLWVTVVHLAFLTWTVVNNHFPALFIGGFLFYIAFTQATEHHQHELSLRPALLVGFFLAGLVVHGGLQGWWIGPTLRRLSETPLFFGAATLTAFNDNAAITYLASLVPDFRESLKYAVVAGAVAGGGLTVIANAPNPAGQSILGKFFPDGVSAWRLFLGALIPTLAICAAFLLFR